MGAKQSPLVSISCITYNHHDYIRRCLDGFVMQKTSFDFEVLIHDDCSTDGTTEIIKEYEQKYPKLIRPIYEVENQWVKGRRGSNIFNFPRAKGKYITMCEGDDYWNDPLKLQKQVDILEMHPEYSCCTHQSIIVRDGVETDEFFANLDKSKNVYTLKDVLGDRLFHTASYMFRNNSLLLNIPKVVSGDKLLIQILGCIGDIYYIPETMSVYRKTGTGMSATVKIDAMKMDLNMIPFLKKIKMDFPVLHELSYIYKTIALYPHDATLFQRIKYLTLYFVLSFSYFPNNLLEILRKLKGRIL